MTGAADDLRERAERLRAERRAYVTATVVRAERPTSAKPGDSALVLDDGTIVGFVGGECAQASVQVQALAAMDSGQPVLLRISPDAEALGAAPLAVEAGTITVHNPCLSGGALDIFLEPVVPPTLVIVHGDAPIARAVRDLAGWLGFEVQSLDAELQVGTDAVVVATHGGAEHEAIAAALRAGVPYVGLIASPRRGAAVLDVLDVDDAGRARVHTPAGFDIGAHTPQEVALSVLAEIVSVRPKAARPSRDSASGTPGTPGTAASPAIGTDPVCGMQVAAVEASHHLDLDGVRYWFCGSGCEAAFRADPAAFLP